MRKDCAPRNADKRCGVILKWKCFEMWRYVIKFAKLRTVCRSRDVVVG